MKAESVFVRTGAIVVTSALCAAAHASGGSAGGVAVQVLGYDSGTNANPLLLDAHAALGGIERFTGEGVFPGQVTPFFPAFGAGEIVSVGSGGSLTLRMGGAIADHAGNPFGIDMIVFGNSGFIDTTFFDTDDTNDGMGVVGDAPGLFGVGGEVTVQVSADGQDWRTAAVTALGLFPTLGYQDATAPAALSPGSVLTDQFQAMDPSLGLGDLAGLSFAEIMALYGSSAGGVGIDISSTGLTSASFVRLLNESGEAFEVDAVIAVPTPGAVGVCAVVGVLASSRWRRSR